MSNTFGTLFRLTTFGESHGPAIGGVVDGCPAGLELDEASLQHELDLRSAAHSGPGATSRKEPDKLRILSGVFNGRTLGSPIAFLIENQQQNPHDYDALKNIYRPGHADYPWELKYGLRDWRGGGRSSGRETAARVAGGAIALQLLQHFGIRLFAYTLAIGGIQVKEAELPTSIVELEKSAARPFFAPADSIIQPWRESLEAAKNKGDSLGGLVRLEAQGFNVPEFAASGFAAHEFNKQGAAQYSLPIGLGEPVFDKLDARLGSAIFSVGAVKGVEIGAGFAAANMTGSQNNDAMLPDSNFARFASNHAGGVLGGLSTGQPLVLTVAVKPIPSIRLPQQTVDGNGQATPLKLDGRHDVCAIPRINQVLKAMLALTLADFMLLRRSSRL